ncbi:MULTISPECIES: dihydrodipicolinate synthase family protein [Leeia]|uniref:Dihydrodipicolinate synthase family protein n=1 Tax=Leeia aquatica TaxID=2725557 RepID=A0A847S709_9NEIS|nr:dihydrodipicolinate synthase family protein [Leeia aquatica]NLR75533.1 dihydrodipicolinate synthase family protein [Leeia aquatica]
MACPWTGVYPAVTTKFTADGALDLAGTQQHIEWQIDCGADGIIVCGSLGENSTLSFDEKLAVLGAGLKASRGRVPVLLTVAEGTTADACRLAKLAEEQGANGLMVLPGMRYVSDRRETIAHYRAVAQASKLPIMLYINPLAYVVDITPDMLVEMADEPNFVAIKESTGDVRRVTQVINACGDRYGIFCGVDDLAMEEMAMGATGWVAGLVTAFPKETVTIYRLVQAGRWEEARAIYRWFQPLLRLDISTKLVQNIKLAEAIVGVGTEHVRAPRLPLVGEERAQVEKIIRTALEKRPTLPQI